MAKPPGKCIFCSGGGLSKEHVFPKWVQQILPRGFGATDHHITRPHFENLPKLEVPSSYRPVWQGDPLVRRLYVVCKRCNSGWMSRLQEAAKPTLTPLILGDWSVLTPENQITIAAWATMTTMVLEFADPPTAHISASERGFLMEHKTPPPRWQIWMGKFVGIQNRLFWHSAFVQLPDNPSTEIPDDTKGQITTFRLGHAFFCLLSTPEGVAVEINPGFMVGSGIAPIWPQNRHSVRTIRTIDDQHANRIHSFIRNIFE